MFQALQMLVLGSQDSIIERLSSVIGFEVLSQEELPNIGMAIAKEIRQQVREGANYLGAYYHSSEEASSATFATPAIALQSGHLFCMAQSI